MAEIINALAREDVSIIAITTNVGGVYTISPSHRAYDRIRKLTLSREDDATLLGLVTGEIDPPMRRQPVAPLLPGRNYDQVTTDGCDVWVADEKVPDAIGSELIFLTSCVVADQAPPELEQMLHFAEMITKLAPDQPVQRELVSLYVKRLLPLTDEGLIKTTPRGIIFKIDPEGTRHIMPSSVSSITRRSGDIFLTI